MEYPVCQGHNICKEHGCFSKTNIDKGECGCPFKGSCHLIRQSGQAEWREESNTSITDCDFYKLLKPRYIEREQEKRADKI